MFDTVMKGFQDARLKLKGQARLTEDNISEALDAVKRSLLDADVEYGVVKSFIAEVKEKCLGSVVQTRAGQSGLKVQAGDHFIDQCQSTLTEYLGGGTASLELNGSQDKPAVVLLVGLQGAGKTTHAAKLALHLRREQEKSPLLVAADVYRPAAREQLRVLAEREGLGYFTQDSSNAVEIAVQGISHARANGHNVVIIDTAGRLAIDDQLMLELEQIRDAVRPENTVLVIDSMIGQDAVQTAEAFHRRLEISGVILTKLDGDTRGGAALSVKKVTGRPILFAGTGEALDQIEEFRPEGMASRILGLGDIVGLMGDFKKAIDEEEAEKSAVRLMEGHFDFNDFLQMMGSIQKMGPIKDILAKTPMMAQIPQEGLDQVNDRELVRISAMVQSMTGKEKQNPDLLLQKSAGGRSRIARIARGSGRSEKDVRELVERFMQMRQVMQMMMGGFGGGLLSKLPGLGQLNKLANMAKMMKGMPAGMTGSPGMPGLGGLGDLMGAGPSMGPGAGLSSADLAHINRERKKKKLAKKQKQKNRK
jgi:signal recognition particle subunit SRP54